MTAKFVQIPAEKIGMGVDFDLCLNCRYQNGLIKAREGSKLAFAIKPAGTILGYGAYRSYLYYDQNAVPYIIIPTEWPSTDQAIFEIQPYASFSGGVFQKLNVILLPDTQDKKYKWIGDDAVYAQVLDNLFINNGNGYLYMYRREPTSVVGQIKEVTFERGLAPSLNYYLTRSPKAKLMTTLGNGLVFANIDSEDSIPLFNPVPANHPSINRDILRDYNSLTETYEAMAFNRNYIIYSEPLRTHDTLSIPGGADGYYVRINSEEEITALAVLKYNLFVFTLNETHLVQIQPKITETTQRVVNKSVGCVSQDSVREVNGDVYFLARDGFYSIGEGGFKKISPDVIDRIIQGRSRQVVYKSVWEKYNLSLPVSMGTPSFNMKMDFDRMRSAVNLSTHEYICQIPIQGADEKDTLYLIYNYSTGLWYMWLGSANVMTDGGYKNDLEGEMLYEVYKQRLFVVSPWGFVTEKRGAERVYAEQVPVLIQSRELFSEQDNEVQLNSMKVKHYGIFKDATEDSYSFIDSEGAYLEIDTPTGTSGLFNMNTLPEHIFPDKSYFWGASTWGGTIWKKPDLVTHAMSHCRTGKWHRIGVVVPVGETLAMQNMSLEIAALTPYGEIGEQS